MLGVCNRLPSFVIYHLISFATNFALCKEIHRQPFFYLQLNRFQTPVHTPLECQLFGPYGGPLFQSVCFI